MGEISVSSLQVEDEEHDEGPQGIAPILAGMTHMAASTLGIRLANDISSVLARFFHMGEEERIAVTLWVLHTWVIAAAEYTPYLYIHSAERRSGKSNLLDTLELLTPRPYKTSSASPAAIRRILMVEGYMPTLLLDEVDEMLFVKNREAISDYMTIFNSGYAKHGKALLVVPEGKRDYAVVSIATFAPKVLCGIDRHPLPDTLADRSIPIRMERSPYYLDYEKMSDHAIQGATESIRTRLEVWGNSAPFFIDPDYRPETELRGRAEDIWQPLFGVSDFIGGEWMDLARQSAMKLNADTITETVGVQLLAEMRRMFNESGADTLWTYEVCNALLEDDESPWQRLGRGGKPVEPLDIAIMLRPYGIKSKALRLMGLVRRGFNRGMFEGAWRQYLPPPARDMAPGQGPIAHTPREYLI